ncbi:MAG: DNA recombination protein RmuC, partial [Chitinophagaceae bacterium]|nr:DNA recombination protein RmuC [Chitinophagaceae bacterium]
SKISYENLERENQELIIDKKVKEQTMLHLDQQIADVSTGHKQLQEEFQRSMQEVSKLGAELQFKEEQLNQQKEVLEHTRKEMEREFQLMAGKILDEKTKVFKEQQENSLTSLLEPLKTNIKEFKQEFESKLNQEAKEKGSLSEQIKQMLQLNQNLSKQADNLTKALSNNVKQQGDWGEGILESILEHVGLQKDLQYFVQFQTTNEEGATIRPDVLVKYPDGRTLVIDSKVSLVHHNRYCAAENGEEQAVHLAQLVFSLKQHIDGLSRKSYHDITNALDLVIMFVPNEAAYITAMQADFELWQYAYKKRILLISPTNLIPAMKLVADMWQKDAIGKNAMEIAEKAGKLYDKLAGFVENFERVGAQIDKAQDTWKDAYKQLYTGKGNLVSQAEQMRKMQIKASKQLPVALTDHAALQESTEETELTD